MLLCLPKQKTEDHACRSPTCCCSHQDLLTLGVATGLGPQHQVVVAAAGTSAAEADLPRCPSLHRLYYHSSSSITRHHSSNLNHHVLGYHHLSVLIPANFLRWRQEGQRLRWQRLLRLKRLGRLRRRFWLCRFCVLFQTFRLGLVSVYFLQSLFLLRYPCFYY